MNHPERETFETGSERSSEREQAQPNDGLIDLETEELAQAAGGSDGTVLGTD